jgi:hypothetical protein
MRSEEKKFRLLSFLAASRLTESHSMFFTTSARQTWTAERGNAAYDESGSERLGTAAQPYRDASQSFVPAPELTAIHVPKLQETRSPLPDLTATTGSVGVEPTRSLLAGG